MKNENPTTHTQCSESLRKAIGQLKYTSASRTLHSLILSDGQMLLVVGDPDNGAYEWVLLDYAGNLKNHSNVGYGSSEIALRDGLIEVHGLPVVPKKCYVVSLKHTRYTDKYICFWRPANAGYAYHLKEAGQYLEDVVRGHDDYYATCDTVAVPCHVLDEVASLSVAGVVDRHSALVVKNTAENWRLIFKHMVVVPVAKVYPKHRGAQRLQEAKA